MKRIINNGNYIPPAHYGDRSMTSSQHYLQISALNYEINNNNGSLPRDVRNWIQDRVAWYEQPEQSDNQLDFNDFIEMKKGELG